MRNSASDPQVVLVTGANGFVGSHVVKALVKRGHHIKAVVRKTTQNSSEFVEVVNANLSKSIDWTRNLGNVSTVIHLAARVHQMNESLQDSLDDFTNINTRATLELAEQSAKAGIKRFVYLSTIAVNGSFTLPGEFLTENSPPCPKSSYAISKYEAELGLQKIAQQYTMEVVIIRPPMVYGANAPGNFSKLISLVKTRIPLPFRSAKNLRSFIYVGNLVSFIETCINHPAAGNELFLISDDDDISLGKMIKQVSQDLGFGICFFSFPLIGLEGLLLLLGQRRLVNQLLKPLRIDISKAKRILEWIPPYSLVDGIRSAIKNI
jgi:nucleoside-diphosphate-sugar epimerase